MAIKKISNGSRLVCEIPPSLYPTCDKNSMTLEVYFISIFKKTINLKAGNKYFHEIFIDQLKYILGIYRNI